MIKYKSITYYRDRQEFKFDFENEEYIIINKDKNQVRQTSNCHIDEGQEQEESFESYVRVL